MRSNWRGILKILDIQHVRDGKVIWSEQNIHNLLHASGEQFMLLCAFDNDGNVVPANYYFGLDNRTVVAVTDTMASISSTEPTSGGYTRQTVASSGGFTVEAVSGIYRAVGPILTFNATGIGYGPVKNLFLTTASDNSGYLLSTAVLSSSVTLTSGDSINLRMSIQLADISL
jgi:hypothetical protein